MSFFDLLTYRDLSAKLGVNRGTLKRWRHEGMPGHEHQRHVRFDLAEVQVWIDARRSDPNKLRRIRGCTFERSSSVYFGRGENELIKIGFTSDTSRRGYEVDCEVIASVPGDKRIEAIFHRAFAADHAELEWFRPSERLVAFVNGLASMQTVRAA